VKYGTSGAAISLNVAPLVPGLNCPKDTVARTAAKIVKPKIRRRDMPNVNIRKVLHFAILSFLVSLPSTLVAATVDQDDDYMVITFDAAPSEQSLSDESRSQLKRKRNSKERKQMLAEDQRIVLAQRKEMKKNGFVVASEEEVSAMYYYLGDIPERKAPDVVEPAMGFRSTALSSGLTIVGVYGEPSDDGKYYDIVSVADSESLGSVIIEETKTGGEYGIRRLRIPRFDLSINGNPALLSVIKTADGGTGLSTLLILTDESFMSITVLYAVQEGTVLYDNFFELAHELY
jgi:hypothetical protein